MTKIDMELIRLLEKIENDDDFILAVMSYASNETDRKKIIDFIKADNDVDEETVTVLAIRLSQARKK